MCNELKASDVVVLIQCMKASKAFKNQAMFCTLCSVPIPHLMRCNLLSCCCMQCKQAPSTPLAHGGENAHVYGLKVSQFECGDHVTRVMPSHNRDLTAAQYEIAKEMAKASMKSARIRLSFAKILLQFRRSHPSFFLPRTVLHCRHKIAKGNREHRRRYGWHQRPPPTSKADKSRMKKAAQPSKHKRQGGPPSETCRGITWSGKKVLIFWDSDDVNGGSPPCEWCLNG
ncbi:LOW QUALITY PROTEIN: hypothetical protein PHMEG_0007378 [Phytophthora megakarya]|uniref:Uncharacterized protein n=1 Tax=Phytophthora megakarya TaxID=4795 RepID=A0A225WND6_9STRA|nr:LOW QUALITY PROTEIN: hypothetical protein PHMEG_0007378 [Phytophthora megakarya]